MLKSLLAASILVAVTGCATASQSSSNEQETQYQASEKAINLAHEYLLVDTHIDVPYRIRDKWDDVSVATKDGDFDYPRAVEGGLDAPFMSIYIPASYEESGGSVQLAHELIDGMEALVARAPDKFAMAYSTDDIRANKEKA